MTEAENVENDAPKVIQCCLDNSCQISRSLACLLLVVYPMLYGQVSKIDGDKQALCIGEGWVESGKIPDKELLPVMQKGSVHC